MKKLRIVIVCMLLAVWAGGCEEALLIGGGATGGAALSNTIEGAKKDLELREQQLIELYNQGVEQGMEKQELDEIKQDIIDTRLFRETAETGEKFLDIDWNDPTQTGGAIGLVSSLILLWLNRKKLTQTTKELNGKTEAINKFCGTNEPIKAAELHDIVKEKTANL